MKIKSVSVEYRNQWLGAANPRPRISWQITAEERNIRQEAYQIQTALDEDFQKVIWDSGKVVEAESIHIPYAGPALQSGTRYYYRVKIWDNLGRESGFSDPDFWETAFLDNSEWQADWITPDYDYQAPKTGVPVLRRQFRLAEDIVSARLYITAKGVYEAYINGEKAGDDMLAPGWTVYQERLQYQTYDVTRLIKTGENAISVMIGSGWYKGELGWRSRRNLYGGREALIAQLHVTYGDGSTACICTDQAWKSSYRGPIVFAEIYHGETYDSRINKGFGQAGFDDQDWFGVRLMKGAGKDNLIAQESEPVRIMETIRPLRLFKTPKGELLLDMGQNMTGWIQFQVKGKAGERVVLSHAEVLDEGGNFYVDNLKGARQRIEYILSGDASEVYRPHFTYQGFRYVHIEEYPGEPQITDFTGLVLYSSLADTGTFRCSNEMINQLQHNIVWGQKGNFLDIPTDCPQRCERLGWTADIQIFAQTAAFNMQIPLFLKKWLRDLKAEQFASGGVPWVVPNIYDETYQYDLAGYTGQSEPVAAAWGDAATICPWIIYVNYGDQEVLTQQYDSMKAYVEFIRQQGDNPNLWNTGHQLGDWVALDAPYGSFIGATDVYYVATAYYAYSTQIVAQTAKILGFEEDYCKYSCLYKDIKAAFAKEYIDPDGNLTVQTQTALILAVQFDLVDEAKKQRYADRLAKWLAETNYDLITGFVGTPYICHVLTRYGHTATAYQLLLKKEYPSWLYQITRGATTVWEHLDGLKPDGTLWNPRMNSFNHYAYGAVGEWLYQGIAGLRPDSARPGYRSFYVEPQIDGPLDFAEASYESMYGTIAVHWQKEAGKTVIRLAVPVNTTAVLCLPEGKEIVLQNDGESGERDRISSRVENGKVTVSLGSGEYWFVVI